MFEMIMCAGAMFQGAVCLNILLTLFAHASQNEVERSQKTE